MLILGNAFKSVDLKAFESRVTKDADGPVEFICELKIDGLAISLTYETCHFVRGATRGDGTVGEDITSNLRTIRSIPFTIAETETIEVRGEAFMPRKSFISVNESLELKEEGLFANQ